MSLRAHRRARGRESGARCWSTKSISTAAVPPRRSAVHLGPEFVCTNSLTKVYGLSGLRCGWILAEPELAERMWRLNDLFGVNQAHQAERLACIAFDHIDEVIGDNPEPCSRRNRELFNAFVAAATTSTARRPSMASPPFPRWAGGDTERLDDHLRDRYDTCGRSWPLVRDARPFPHRLRPCPQTNSRRPWRASARALDDLK